MIKKVLNKEEWWVRKKSCLTSPSHYQRISGSPDSNPGQLVDECESCLCAVQHKFLQCNSRCSKISKLLNLLSLKNLSVSPFWLFIVQPHGRALLVAKVYFIWRVTPIREICLLSSTINLGSLTLTWSSKFHHDNFETTFQDYSDLLEKEDRKATDESLVIFLFLSDFESIMVKQAHNHTFIETCT